jgi:hypothetical protein
MGARAPGYTDPMATFRNTPAYAGASLRGRLALARLVTAVAGVVAAIIVLAIVLHVLNANPSNGIVDVIHQAGSWLSAPFHGLFSPHDADLRMAVNWGLAALVYVIAARLIARLLLR